MSNYLTHMEELGQGTAFGRRVEYLKYNFKTYLQGLSKSSKVLEIGPGTGELLHLLNEKSISNIDIIDNDSSILKYCKNKYKINQTTLSKSLDLSKSIKSKYDLIILTQVFEHIPKSSYQNWLKTLYTSLRPGGHIIITVPNGANPLVGTERYGDLQHENIFTIFSFQELMTFANLKNVQYAIKAFEIPPINVVNVLRIILQKILHGFFILLMIINGGIYQTLMTPNITLVITKKRS
ncbi:class I SAM-dependent methyltransferase [Candidatus Woesebacteria bacterium]|nr:class I SAM-dependent methyltransferase [Candidatus Woesebacteria bacterium]